MRFPPSRVRAIRRRLLAWWDAGHRALPWRDPENARDPYRVWLAEVMLQQTQVAVAAPFYERFVGRLPTLEALAGASEDEVLALWSGLGYYSRARRLLAAGREALARHGGLPASLEDLARLPGFGRYTAGAVASIAFGIRAPCVDGNVARVLARLVLVEDAPEERRGRERLWAAAAELVAPDRPGDFNQALMELGATVCRKRGPRCGACPLARSCAARRAGREQEVPRSRRRSAPGRLAIACAVIRQGDALLVTRRPPGGLFGGLWELPTVVVETGDDPREALRRELHRRLGLRAEPAAPLATVERRLTHRRLVVTAYACRAGRVPPGARLATRADLEGMALSTAMRRVLRALPC